MFETILPLDTLISESVLWWRNTPINMFQEKMPDYIEFIVQGVTYAFRVIGGIGNMAHTLENIWA